MKSNRHLESFSDDLRNSIIKKVKRNREHDMGCANCGRPEHSGPLWEQMLDGDNNPVMIEICKYFREQKRGKKDD
jgi:hypothetical protein